MGSNRTREAWTCLRSLGSVTLAAALSLSTLGVIAVAGLWASAPPSASPAGETAEGRGGLPEPIGRLVVAIVLGSSGSDTADVLTPFEIFASSGDFAVYIVAESALPAPLDAGLGVVPSFTFADVSTGAAPAPDLIVVPAVNSPSGPEEQGAREFVAAQFRAGVRVLGVCAGSRLLAAAGILDGLRATSHWSRISALESSNPDVAWVRGERYVQDGLVTTTGGVTSSVAGSLKVMADLAGPAEAGRVGNLINYPGWRLDASPSMPAQSFDAGDLSVLANFAFPWARPAIDVRLNDGMDEIEVGALVEVYTYSQAATVTASSQTGTITTRRGLVLRTASSGTTHSEVVLPGTADDDGLTGFDAAFSRLSRHAHPSVVTSVAKMLEYPLDRVPPHPAPIVLQWRPELLAALSLAVAVAVGAAPTMLNRTRRLREPSAAAEATTSGRSHNLGGQ